MTQIKCTAIKAAARRINACLGRINDKPRLQAGLAYQALRQVAYAAWY